MFLVVSSQAENARNHCQTHSLWKRSLKETRLERSSFEVSLRSCKTQDDVFMTHLCNSSNKRTSVPAMVVEQAIPVSASPSCARLLGWSKGCTRDMAAAGDGLKNDSDVARLAVSLLRRPR